MSFSQLSTRQRRDKAFMATLTPAARALSNEPRPVEEIIRYDNEATTFPRRYTPGAVEKAIAAGPQWAHLWTLKPV